MNRGLNLKRSAALSTLWSVSQFGSDQLFNFIIYVFLARLLSPAEFGVFVLASIMVEVGKIVGAGGMSSAIVRAPVLSDSLIDTIFWSNLAFALILAALYALLSHPIAALLGNPATAPIVAVMGIAIPIGALGTSHMALNLRQFGHKALAIRSVAGGLVGGSLGIAAAFAGWGVWSLVVQRLTVEIIGAVVAWFSYRWRPGFNLSWANLRSDGVLGLAGAGSQVLTLALYRGQDIIISHVFSAARVGAFRNGCKLIEILSQGIGGPMSGIAVPTLAHRADDPAGLNRALVRMIEACAIVLVPCVAGVGVLGADIVPALYGPKWAESIPVVQALAITALPLAVSNFFISALLVLGRPRLILRLMTGHVAVALGACALAAPFGLVAIVLTFAANEYAWMAARALAVRRASGLELRLLARVLVPPAASALIMVALLMAARSVPGLGVPAPAAAGHVLRLLLLVPLGAACYALCLYAIGGVALRDRLFALAGEIRRKPQMQG